VDALPSRVAGAYCGCGFLLEGVDLTKVRLAVDLGCGAGMDARLLAEKLKGGMVLALDMAVPMLKRVREAAVEENGNPVRLSAGDMECLPIREGVADLVLANASLNLLVDKGKALADIRRVLRPGGRFVARELLREGPLPDEIAQDPTAWNASLGGVMEEGEWRLLFQEAGFSEVTISDHRPFRPVIAARMEAVKPLSLNESEI
jgi:ubiquinone/menaquinone biosynthesis C-methylase UbiE